jgi:diacylglycerol kinase family enzyme
MRAVRLGVVANTKSGGADGASEAESLLREAGAEVRVVPLDALGDGPGAVDPGRVAAVAAELTGRGGEAGGSGGASGPVDRIVAAGGDGSLGPAALLALRAGLPLAVVPVGTANSFARWMDIPLDARDAAALAARPDAATRPAEVADAGGRPFVNVAAAGLSVLAAERARPLKARLGPLAYAVGAARAALTGRPLRTRVVADGREVWAGDAWQVLVAATGAFGGDSATGGVDPADGRLDVAIVPAGPRRALLRRAYAMRRGRLVHSEEVVHRRGRDVRLEVGGRPGFNVDGEVLDLDDARFTVAGRIGVVAP